MAEDAKSKIEKYIEEAGVDPDWAVRQSAGSSLYTSYLLTGEEDLRDAALKIWKEIKLTSKQIAEEIEYANKGVKKKDSF